MALRFGSQALASGLLLAAQTALLGTLITGTGDFSVALGATQSGQGEIADVQQVTGTGSHGVSLTATQDGSGRLPQIVYNTGSTIEWGQSIGVSQEGDGESAVEPPQTVAGTADFSAAIGVSQSGSGGVVIPPQQAAGSGDHGISLTISWDGAGESVTPAQVVQGGGAFTLGLGVTQSGGGESEVPEDTAPNPFPFTHQTGVALEATITSAPVTITGINAPSPITVSGGEYSINGGAFTDQPGTVENGDQVRARHESSDQYLTATHTVITIGGVSDTFTSITLGDPEQAAYIARPFSFNWWRA